MPELSFRYSQRLGLSLFDVDIFSFWPRRIFCVGAECFQNGSFLPKVKGSVWEISGGIYKLVRCPAGYQLINTLEDDEFSQQNQFCKPCLPGQYIIDPNRDICQACPNGVCPFDL